MTMDESPRLKPLRWMGSSKRDLKALPRPVEDLFGFALYLAQAGKKHEQAKPLKGFGSAGVLEVTEDWDRVRIEPSTRYGSSPQCSCCMCSRRNPRVGRPHRRPISI